MSTCDNTKITIDGKELGDLQICQCLNDGIEEDGTSRETWLNPSKCELSGTFRDKDFSNELKKLQEMKLKIWSNELKERKEIQQRTKDSNEYIRPCPYVDKIVTKLTDESVYGYYDCLHIYYHHGEKGARGILKSPPTDDLLIPHDCNSHNSKFLGFCESISPV